MYLIKFFQGLRYFKVKIQILSVSVFCYHAWLAPCSLGWLFDYSLPGSCYLQPNVTPLTAEQAQSFCQAKGANLAGVNSKDELELLAEITNENEVLAEMFKAKSMAEQGDKKVYSLARMEKVYCNGQDFCY